MVSSKNEFIISVFKYVQLLLGVLGSWGKQVIQREKAIIHLAFTASMKEIKDRSY